MIFQRRSTPFAVEILFCQRCSIAVRIILEDRFHTADSLCSFTLPVQGHAQFVDGIRRFTMVAVSGCHNGERLLRLFKLIFGKVNLAQPVIGIDRQIALVVFINKVIDAVNGFVEIPVFTNKGLDCGVIFSLFCGWLTVLPLFNRSAFTLRTALFSRI
jgi:hypothetical protein